MDNRAPVGVVVRVKYEGLQGVRGISHRRGQPCNNRFQEFVNPDPFLGRGEYCSIRVESKIVFNLIFGRFHVGSRKIYLVDNRNNLKIMIHSHVKVCDCLRLHSLARVNEN